MSGFFHPMTQHRAAKARRCIYCGEQILKGEVYNKQCGVWDGDWFISHYHPECWDDMAKCDDDDFSPYDNPRPLTAAELEYRSWDCAALVQGRLL